MSAREISDLLTALHHPVPRCGAVLGRTERLAWKSSLLDHAAAHSDTPEARVLAAGARADLAATRAELAAARAGQEAARFASSVGGGR